MTDQGQQQALAPTPEQVLENHDVAIQRIEKTIQGMLSDMNVLNEKLSLLVKTVGKAPTPKAKLPDTDKFTGVNFSFETWLPMIRAKLRLDGKAIGNAEAQFFYVYSRLDGKIQALVMPQLIQSSDSGVFDPQALLDQLARIYDDPNKVQQAEAALHAIQQHEDPFSVFIAKFERLLYKAQANTWSEPAKISLLRQALNKETRKRALQIRPQPTTYVDYVDKLKEVLGSIHFSGKYGGNHKDKDAMDVDVIQAALSSIEFSHVASREAPDEALPPAPSTTATVPSASTSRAQLNTVAALYDDDDVDDDNNSVSSYDSRASHSSEDFERKLERMHYGDGLARWGRDLD